jgi:hypothetical protein
VAIDAGWVCTPTKFSEGCGLVAGYGPSGDSERPGFAWWFGGDALMASWAMLDYGDHAGALQVLRFLKARQRADGKMMHEMTQSVDLVDWFGKYGFAYYHADTTPMYIYSVGEYWRRTGDKKFLEEFWPSVKKAYEYCISTVDPTDGLMDNTKAGLAAVEVGPLRGKVVKDIYLQGFWLAALNAARAMALELNERQFAGDARALASKATQSLREAWWNPEGQHFAFGLTADKKRADILGAWPAVLLALAYPNLGRLPLEPSPEDLSLRDILDRQAQKFATPELSTDWGIRWISNKDSLYDPLSYNNGTVWPFISGFVAWAQYNAGRSISAYTTLACTARLTGSQSPGALPEHMVGDRNHPGERSVPHQLFSSWSVVVPSVRGLFGLGVVPSEKIPGQLSLQFAPQIPIDWPIVRFSNYFVGTSRASGEIRQQPNRITLVVQFEGTPVPVQFSPRLPKGHLRQVLLNGKPMNLVNPKLEILWGSSEKSHLQLHVAAPATKRSEVVIEYEGTVGIVPVAPKSEPGGQATALRILEAVHWANEKDERKGEMKLTVAGLGGRTYALDLVTTVPALVSEGASTAKTGSGYRLEISFEGREGEYVTREIRSRW